MSLWMAGFALAYLGVVALLRRTPLSEPCLLYTSPNPRD